MVGGGRGKHNLISLFVCPTVLFFLSLIFTPRCFGPLSIGCCPFSLPPALTDNNGPARRGAAVVAAPRKRCRHEWSNCAQKLLHGKETRAQAPLLRTEQQLQRQLRPRRPVPLLLHASKLQNSSPLAEHSKQKRQELLVLVPQRVGTT